MIELTEFHLRFVRINARTLPIPDSLFRQRFRRRHASLGDIVEEIGLAMRELNCKSIEVPIAALFGFLQTNFRMLIYLLGSFSVDLIRASEGSRV